MRLVASAQAFGFGPVAKLVALLGQVDGVEATFVGTGIALQYAELNHDVFADVMHFDLSDKDRGRQLVRTFDAAVSVMEPDLVFACAREQVPVHFFDSLTGFWANDRSIEELSRAARAICDGASHAAKGAMASLSVHESMIVSHMLATRSYAQSFPGVAERIATLTRAGAAAITMTASMVDQRELHELGQAARRTPRSLVVNLGGFVNAFLDGSNSRYVNVIMRWLRRVAATTTRFDDIVVCSGLFREPTDERSGRARLRTAFLPHRELMELLANRPTYLTAPGLTSLHEAIQLGVLPMLLPDQHYGHAYNRRGLHGTTLARYGASFADLGLGTDIPHDDKDGTLAIAEVSAQIDRDDELFERFASYMDGRLEAFVASGIGHDATALAQFEQLVRGIPITDVVGVLDGGRRVRSGDHAD